MYVNLHKQVTLEFAYFWSGYVFFGIQFNRYVTKEKAVYVSFTKIKYAYIFTHIMDKDLWLVKSK